MWFMDLSNDTPPDHYPAHHCRSRLAGEPVMSADIDGTDPTRSPASRLLRPLARISAGKSLNPYFANGFAHTQSLGGSMGDTAGAMLELLETLVLVTLALMGD